MKDSDNEAFTAIYNRYWESLLTTVYRILGDQETARDIVQNIFISLWHKRRETEIKYLKAYLLQAGRFAVYKEIRQRKNDESFYQRLAYITMEIVTEEPLLLKEQKRLLEQLLADLPEHCKETFRLSREENLTYKQIAEKQGISEKTVEKRISTCLAAIRSGLTVAVCMSILDAFFN